MQKIAKIVATVLVLIMFSIPLYILKNYILPGNPSAQSTRIINHTGSTFRIEGETKEEVAISISKMLYPVERRENPSAIVLVEDQSWQKALLGIKFAGYPYGLPVFFMGDTLNTETKREIKRLSPSGEQAFGGAQVICIGEVSLSIREFLEGNRLETIYFDAPSIEKLSASIDQYLWDTRSQSTGNILFVSGEQADGEYALTAASWIAHGGDHLFFIGETIEDTVIERLLALPQIKEMYYVGRGSLRDTAKKQIQVYGEIKEITAPRASNLAIKFAKYRDAANNFGWGASKNAVEGYRNYYLVSHGQWENVIAIAPLQVRGKFGPVLWTEGDKLEPMTETYLWEMKPQYISAAIEGPIHHIWAVGSDNQISFNVQGRASFINEISSYLTRDKQGVSPLEVFLLLWIFSAFCSAVFVGVHVYFRHTQIYSLQKYVWVLGCLVLGPVGLVLYFVSYQTVYSQVEGNPEMIVWKRPVWNQAAVATLTGAGFTGSTMIIVIFLFSRFGMPMIIEPRIWLGFGNPLMVTLLLALLAALLINGFIVYPAIRMDMKKGGYRKTLRESWWVPIIGTSVVGIGGILFIWWAFMEYIGRIPEEEEIVWLGLSMIGVLIGGVIAFIPNYYYVQYDLKLGNL